MRFRAKITDHEELLKLLQSCEKFEKEITIKFSKTKLLFISQTGFSEGVQIWSGCKASTMLSDVNCESQTKNEIYILIDLKNLIRALKSAPMADEMKIKLSKKDNIPSLTIEMSVDGLDITQNIPIVNILSAEEISNLVEPVLEKPTVSIVLPALKDMKSITDRMKSIDEHVTITATNAGSLTFSVDSTLVAISTIYKGLGHPMTQSTRDAFNRNADVLAVAKIDLAKFQKFLHVAILNPLEVICSIVEEKVVVMNVKLEDLYITYYLPIIQ